MTGKSLYSYGDTAVSDNEDKIKLIDLCSDGNIRIWNFHSGVLLNRIKVSDGRLLCVCLWDNNHLCLSFTLSGEFKLPVCNLKLFDLKNYEICEEIMDIKERNIDKIKRFQHPLYGDCLITQCSDENIKLWKLKNGN